MSILAIIVTCLIFIPVSIYFFSVVGRDREQPEPEQVEPQAEQDDVTVERVDQPRQTVVNVALTWIKQTISGGDRQAIDPPRPKPAPDPEDDWTPPTNLDGMPDLSAWDVEVRVDRPAPEPPPEPSAPPAAGVLVVERGLLDRVRDWLGGSKPAPLPPELARPPALGQVDPDWLATIPDPRQLPTLELPDLPVLDASARADVQVEHIPAEPADPPPEVTVTAEVVEPVEIIAPVELQGVDMDLVPVGRRTMARVPTVSGLVSALRTGGYRILYAWLASFRKANLNDLGNAQHMHRMALAHAQRSRVKLAIAINQLQAVQHDRVGAHVIRACTTTVLQAQREARAAFQVVTYTAELVRASGGVPTSLKDALRALERDHGGMAREARRMTVEPVADLRWYQN
ncbi:hypothetical protein [Nonomuraea sp. SYSU D8015]|uniref:hypothetical protein n=1 Tax=Nonomuraea sp. SYSU D8015 TaxID=2593644 RepID=UPI0016613C91|nr:hypothetical protein [Nonomuraea sp. SYSU D8015]